MNTDTKFWEAIEKLVSTSQIIIVRPKGSAHPKYSDFIYQIDYGYLKETSSKSHTYTYS